jgi:hypothetical protein
MYLKENKPIKGKGKGKKLKVKLLKGFYKVNNKE